MSAFEIILLLSGAGLFLLGAISAFYLFKRAIASSAETMDEANVATLWTLFVLGVSSGLLLLWLALP
ncbi:hypothetical protein GP5015_486 [gamma proteobacterium HTCC5015]|nr:hypothetical protein GP5015_486 [gamma proteobacterium HTCC5015]